LDAVATRGTPDEGLCIDCRLSEGNTMAKKVKIDLDPDLLPVQSRASEAATEVRGMLEAYKAFEVLDQESYDLASEALVEVKTLAKRIEEEKKTATGPLTGVLKTIRGWFAPPEAALAECEGVLKIKIAGYMRAVEEINREAVTEAAAAVQAGDTQGITDALANVSSVDKAPGVSITHRWTFKVTALDMLPIAYLQANEPAIRAAMHESVKRNPDGEPDPIPGVVFYQDQSVSVRT
jgi:hypothetical protein